MARYVMIKSGGAHASGFDRDMNEIKKVIANPPHTWATYEGDPHKHQKIIDMEYSEMMAAKASGNHKMYTENLIHVAAALVAAHHAMTCKEYD